MPPLGYEKLVLSKFVPTWRVFLDTIESQIKTSLISCHGNENFHTNGDISSYNYSNNNEECKIVYKSQSRDNENEDCDLDIDDLSGIYDQIDSCLDELEKKNISENNATENEVKGTTNSCVVVSKGMDTYRILFYLLLYLKNPKHVHEVGFVDISKMSYADIVYAGLFALDFDLVDYYLNINNDTTSNDDTSNDHTSNNDEIPITYIAARSRLILVIGIDYSEYLDYRNCEVSEISFISKMLSAEVNFEFTIPRIGYISRHSIKEREQLYINGGVYCASPEVFVLDILCNSLLVEFVSGIVIMNAHKICTDTRMTFLLHLYKSGNSFGFIKAISDDINTFSDMNVYNYFHCDDLSIHLLPRSDSKIANVLNNPTLQPETHEISVPLPLPLEKIQSTLLIILQKIINHLGKDNTAKMAMAEIEFDINSLIYERGKIGVLEKRLGKPSLRSWDFGDAPTDQVGDDLNALSIFSNLLHLSQKIDEISFLKRVDVIRLSYIESSWMWDKDVLLFFNLSQDRVDDTKPSKIECTIVKEGIYNLARDISKSDSIIMALGVHVYDAIHHHLSEYPIRSLFKDYAEWRANGCLFSVCNLNTSSSTYGKSFDAKTHALLTRIKWIDSLFADYLLQDTLEDVNLDYHDTNIIGIFDDRRECVDVKPRVPNFINSSELDQFDEVITYDSNICSARGLDSIIDRMIGRCIIILHGSLSLFRQIELNCSHLYLKECYKRLQCVDKIDIKVFILLYKDSIHSNSFSYHVDSEVKRWQRASGNLRSRLINSGSSFTRMGKTRSGDLIPMVIVDKREFKSPLPYRLYLDGMSIIPSFLKAGDYIITGNTCIERKSPHDLANSLTIGRLYNQVREMKKIYENVILLIEFEGDNFHLTPFGRIIGYYNRTYTRLITLCLLANNLQLLWSSCPEDTSKLIRRLKENSIEPSAQKIRIELFESDNKSTLVEDFLKKIPCISDCDVYQITKNVNNLRDLSNLTLDDLKRIGFNKNTANEIRKFFHTPITNLKTVE